MKKAFLITAVALLSAMPAVHADVLDIPPDNGMSATPGPLPSRGMSMATVTQSFGDPATRHPAAGGGSPKTPPITRWDYDGYSVFFENRIVIDVVVKNAPAPLSHTDELKR